MSIHQSPPGIGIYRKANQISSREADHHLERQMLDWCEMENGQFPHDLQESLIKKTQSNLGTPENTNLGWLLSQCQRSREALNCLSRDLYKQPDSLELKVLAGISLQRTRDFETSRRVLLEVVAKAPENFLARKYYASALMNTGRWSEGLAELEKSRGELKLLQRTSEGESKPLQTEFFKNPAKLWSGQDLKGRDLVIVGNDRLSDQIQFSRYVNELRKLGAKKIGFVCAPELTELMRSLPEIDRVDSQIFHPFDYFVPVESLPHRFGTTPGAVSAKIPYLFCNQRKIEVLKFGINSRRPQGLALPSARPLLGICWRNHQVENRGADCVFYDQKAGSLDLELLEWGLTALSGEYGIVSFQQDLRLDERNLLLRHGARVIENSEFEDLQGIGELLHCMSRVISVDSPIAHLAGALGLDAHVLLPYVPDWKWAVKGGRSPWYPHLRIHETRREDGWNQTLAEVLSGFEIRDQLQKVS